MNLFHQNGLTFKLNNNDFTAEIIECYHAIGDIFIPRSIINQTQNYLITKIKEGSFKNNNGIISINFSESTELYSIEKDAFIHSSIERLMIPNSLRELKEGWCNDTPKLNEVVISENNKYFKYLDSERKIVVKKNNDDEYDCIIFASRDIERAIIPNFIKCIESYSFFKCNKLENVSISDESQLEFIKENAFSYSGIKSINIPIKVHSIEKETFSFCSNIKSINFQSKSKLKTIQKDAFFESSLESLCLPSSVDNLCDGWCRDTWDLNHVSISPSNKNYKYLDEQKLIFGKSDKNQENFDVLVFAARSIEKVTIPSFVTHISPFAFSWCKNLQMVELLPDSKLFSIGEYAFADSSIFNISIPKGVKRIEPGTFWWCRNFEEINFPENSELDSIGKNAFTHSLIKKLTIPASLIGLDEGWCNDTLKLIHVLVSPNNPNIKYLDEGKKVIISKVNSNEYNSVAFACRDLEKVTIPSFIEFISSFSFSNCTNLQEIRFFDDSKLSEIGESAFAYSGIVSIKIPKGVSQIKLKTFYRCSQLKTVDFYNDSKISSIDENVFFSSPIERLMIPNSLRELKEGWCNDTPKLNEVVISENNKYFKYLDSERKIVVKKNNDDEYDCIIFASRDIERAIIPNFIKCVESYSFFKCNKLENVSISDESQLEFIKENAFSYSGIKSINIPIKVHSIEKETFSFCSNIKSINFQSSSLLKEIGEYVFAYSSLENISVPRNVSIFKKGVFSFCSDIQTLELLSDELFIGRYCFIENENLSLMSLPNAKIAIFSNDFINQISSDFILYIHHDSKLILI